MPALPPKPPPTWGMTTLTLLWGSLKAWQNRSRTVKGDWALVQMVTSSPAFHSTMATWVSKRDVLNGGVGVLALDDPVRLGEASVDIALAHPGDIGDVRPGLRAERRLHVLVASEVGMDPGGAVFEGIELAKDRRQHLVLDVDQLHGPAGDVQALGRNGSDGFAEVPDDVLGKDRSCPRRTARCGSRALCR